MNDGTIVVAGATGTLGGRIVRALLERGPATAGTHQQAGQCAAAFPAGGSGASVRAAGIAERDRGNANGSARRCDQG